MTTAIPKKRGFLAWLAGLDDGVIIRIAFFVMLAGCAAVLWIDYRELNEADTTLAATPDMPVLPAFDPNAPAAPNGPAVTSDLEALRQPLSVRLGPGGTLEVTGTIDVGAAERFRTEVETFREYIRTVALDSPGGSVNDALEMGRLIRARRLCHLGCGRGALRLVLSAGLCRRHGAAGHGDVGDRGAPNLRHNRRRQPAAGQPGGGRCHVGRAKDHRGHHALSHRIGRRCGAVAACPGDAAEPALLSQPGRIDRLQAGHDARLKPPHDHHTIYLECLRNSVGNQISRTALGA